MDSLVVCITGMFEKRINGTAVDGCSLWFALFAKKTACWGTSLFSMRDHSGQDIKDTQTRNFSLYIQAFGTQRMRVTFHKHKQMYNCSEYVFWSNSLDCADYDLAEWIDERLKDVAGMKGAEDSAPQVQTMNILPVIHRLIRFLQQKPNWKKMLKQEQAGVLNMHSSSILTVHQYL